MISPPNLGTLRVIFGGLLASQFTFLVVAFVAVPLPEGASITAGLLEATENIMAAALGLSALSVSIFIPFIRKLTMGKMCLPFIQENTNERLPDDFDSTAQAAIKDALAELKRAQSRYQQGTIVGVAMAESICITGLVLAFTLQHPLLILPFFAWSLVCFGLQWPHENGVATLLSPQARAALEPR